MEKLEELLASHPHFSGGYEALFAACSESGTAASDFALTGNALVACSESAELSMQLGAVFGDKGFWVNATAAYALAMASEPANTEAVEKHAAAIRQTK